MSKNKYRVKKFIGGKIKRHSPHDNYEYAEIQRNLLRDKGICAWIEYDGAVVEKDVKKIKFEERKI